MPTPKFLYPKTEETQSGTKRMDILEVINAGGKEVRKRLTKRGIKIPEISRIRMHCHNKINAGDKSVVSSSRKFFLTLKDDSKAVINITKFL